MVSKPCDNCGTPVTRKPAQFTGKHAYCSQTCYWTSRERAQATRRMVLGRDPQGRRDVTCDLCGTGFSKQSNQLRKRNFCNRDCYYAWKRSQGTRKVNSLGYIVIYVGKDAPGATKSGHMLEHRWVMQQTLGRALIGDENVHHKNGVRDDNRSQPLGQRVTDKIAWAKEFLARYGEA